MTPIPLVRVLCTQCSGQNPNCLGCGGSGYVEKDPYDPRTSGEQREDFTFYPLAHAAPMCMPLPSPSVQAFVLGFLIPQPSWQRIVELAAAAADPTNSAPIAELLAAIKELSQ